jgi:protein subunit release factor B
VRRLRLPHPAKMSATVDPAEVEITAIRTQGAGGQNVKTF